MGWASAGGIFDPVAQALIDLGAPDDMKTRVLGTLISTLQDGDWDTEGESLDQFRHDPTIVLLFRKAGVDDALWASSGVPEGELTFTGRRWQLSCSDCGRNYSATDPSGDAAGHDRLVDTWIAHLRDQHQWTGDPPADWYINRPTEEN